YVPVPDLVDCIYMSPNSGFIVYFMSKVGGDKDLLYRVRNRRDCFYIQEFGPVEEPPYNVLLFIAAALKRIQSVTGSVSIGCAKDDINVIFLRNLMISLT
ncbi:9669_t:CDS:2, partial [Gigaspora margarita]